MSAATFALTIAGSASVRAQAPPMATVQTVPGPTPDADALASAMRRLAENPRDVDALLTAGELSLKVGDPSGAASLFKRAEQIDPANGRVRAGMASILVRSERPGESLRYFSQAERFGLDPRRFASDRGLAYDLIGQQERAQRDYRLVLKSNPDDETVRRYALSLGISGKQDEALEQIDTLLRKNDRGAWRARAFILAMSGDVAGATKIATSMIPGMARGLQPFFNRLAALGPADRAFAVHFGEVAPTAERLADARLTPALAPLPPEARPAPVLVAAAPPPTKAELRKRARERRRRGPIDRVEVASAAPKIATLSPPPGFGSAGASPTDPIRPAPGAVSRAAAPVATSAPPPFRVATLVRRDPTPVQRNEALRAAAQTRPQPEVSAATGQAARPVASAPTRTPPPEVPKPIEVRLVSQPLAIALPPPPAAGASPPIVLAATLSAPIVTVPTTGASPPPAQAGVRGAAESDAAARVAAPAAQAVSPPPAPVVASVSRPSTPVPPRMSEDSILARIVAGITIPGYELGVGPPPTPPPAIEIVSATAVAPPVGTAAEAKPAVDTAAIERKQAEELAAKKAEDERAAAAKKEEERAALAEKKRADANALAAKKAADAKALAVKKVAEEKALAAKQAAEEKKAAKADPPRVWVQVAGGAYEGDLPKAWAAVKAKASALAGRQGYSTPLRATNRVVTGPFKSDQEAQAFVNALGKQGVSAFTFTSSAGQKVTRLPTK